MTYLKTLQAMPTFRDVPSAQLQWLLDTGEIVKYAPGESVFSPDRAIDRLIVVLSGKFIIKFQQDNQYRIVGHFQAQDVTGALPYSRATTATAVAEAQEASECLIVPKSHFREMIHAHEELTTALVHVMSTRIRQFTKQQQQNDKMMALGKLSAGLAHELNNPAAAVVRSARELKKHLGFLPEGFKQVLQVKTTAESVDAVNTLLARRITAADGRQLTLMEKSDLEDQLLDWFEAREIDEGDEMADLLAEYGVTPKDLDTISLTMENEDLGSILHWCVQVLTTEKMVGEIEEASRRIGDLVGAVKSYTHMDQAPEMIRTDIHEGIRNTLKMLNHKVKKSKIHVEEQYAPDLPHPEILVSEMNQVWTNLIDNAIDAMERSEQRMLTIASHQDGDFIHILIADSGTGIPDEVLDNIFDPFYTTKGVGKGTGLGLDVVLQIINQHNGEIKVNSQPGKTVFDVSIPITRQS